MLFIRISSWKIENNSVLREFVLMFGLGYKEGGSATKEDAYTAECASLVRRYAGCISEGSGVASSVFDAHRLLPVLPADWRYCPIHFVRDEKRFDLPPMVLDFFGQIPHVTESKKFERQLMKLSERIQRRWTAVKDRLKITTVGEMNFKPWPKINHPSRSLLLRLCARWCQGTPPVSQKCPGLVCP